MRKNQFVTSRTLPPDCSEGTEALAEADHLCELFFVLIQFVARISAVPHSTGRRVAHTA